MYLNTSVMTPKSPIVLSPAFFTKSRYNDTTSERFVPFSTGNAVDMLLSNGWELMSAKTANTRKASRAPYARHQAVMMHKDMGEIGGLIPTITLSNANDGTAAFKFLAGLFRLICSNGLMVGRTFNSVSVRHLGDRDALQTQLLEGADSTRKMLPEVVLSAREMMEFEMSEKDTYKFNHMAAAIRLPGGEPERLAQVAAQMDLTRRPEDRGMDLWKVFNRVQETAMRGGVFNGRRRMRGLGNFNRTNDINRNLWDLATDTKEGRLGDRYEAFRSLQDAILS
jgi:hypothetical protein